MNETSRSAQRKHDADLPLVSVVLAVRNESAAIDATLESLAAQRFVPGTVAGTWPDNPIELLLVDGASDDGSRERLERFVADHPHARIIDNPSRATPQAFNLGIAQARGRYVAILGAHARYAEDYLATCIDELERHDAVGCSGRVLLDGGHDAESRLVARLLALPLACSSGSFRNLDEGEAVSIPYPVFRAAALRALGGYDEALTRNQDNDLNRRLTDAGHRLWLTWRTSARYSPRSTVAGLMAYAYRNGWWNVATLARTRSAMRWFHFAPLGFVSALLLLGLALVAGTLASALTGSAGGIGSGSALAMTLGVLAVHLLAGTASAWRHRPPAGSAGWATPLVLPFLLLAFHVAYGSGSLVAVLRGAWRATRQGTAVRPAASGAS